MTNIIKVKFLKGGQATGRDYTYFTPEPVEVGDTVDIDTDRGVAKGVVTFVDVPEAEIAPFKDRAKTIIGKSRAKSGSRPSPRCFSCIGVGCLLSVSWCELCAHFTPQGDGIYTCSASPDNRKVMQDFKATPDTMWCEGKNYKEAE